MSSNHCVGSFLSLTTSIGVFGILWSNVDAWIHMYLHIVSCRLARRWPAAKGGGSSTESAFSGVLWPTPAFRGSSSPSSFWWLLSNEVSVLATMFVGFHVRAQR